MAVKKAVKREISLTDDELKGLEKGMEEFRKSFKFEFIKLKKKDFV
jgi:hypothetical protein